MIPIANVWADAQGYLDRLRNVIDGDIRTPLLSTPSQAPITVCREVFCYVDHLGHLYTGVDKQVGQRFETFLRDVMGRIDPNYKKRARELYLMFRNGPVHEFEPAHLENDQGEVLVWHALNPARPWTSRTYANVVVDSVSQTVTHLETLRVGSTSWYRLPVVLGRLVEDLDEAIVVFAQMGNTQRMTLWNRAARTLNAPRPSDFKP